MANSMPFQLLHQNNMLPMPINYIDLKIYLNLFIDKVTWLLIKIISGFLLEREPYVCQKSQSSP
jgi:hypothetical protein